MIRTSIEKLSTFIRRLLRRKPEPLDPYADVCAPLRRGPGGRSSAVALTNQTIRDRWDYSDERPNKHTARPAGLVIRHSYRVQRVALKSKCIDGFRFPFDMLRGSVTMTSALGRFVDCPALCWRST